MRMIFTVVLLCLVSLALGGISAQYAINRSFSLGATQIGQWRAWPLAAGTSADPYTVARVTRQGTIPLGSAEGLEFVATHDSEGQLLQLECSYIISGSTPPANHWTLVAHSQPDNQLVPPTNDGVSQLLSHSILRFSDGSFRIWLDRHPRSGNWLSISGSGHFSLVLRIYDTPIIGSIEQQTHSYMPLIEKQMCRESQT